MAGDRDAVLEVRHRGGKITHAAVGDAQAVELHCHLGLVAQVLPDGQALPEQRDSRGVFALLLPEHSKPVGEPGQRGADRAGRELDRPFQPVPSSLGVAMLVPEGAQGLDQPQSGGHPPVGIWSLSWFAQGPAQRLAKIVVLEFQAVQPPPVRPALKPVQGLLGECGVMLSMLAPDGNGIIFSGQAFEGELADRLQHADTRLTVSAFCDGDQAGVEQLTDPRQWVGRGLGWLTAQGDRRKSLKITASSEHADAPEYDLKVWAQQVIAPGDGVSQRLLPRWTPSFISSQAQALPEARQNGLGRQQLG